MGKKIGIAVGVIIAAVAIVGCLIPLKTVAYTVMVDYQDTETYYEDEPYEKTETYTEKVPLDYKLIESYLDTDSTFVQSRIVIGGVVIQDEIVETRSPIGCVILKNMDSDLGSVKVYFSFYALEKWYYEHTDDFSWQEYKELLDPPYGEHGKPVGESYHTYVQLNLEPGETGTAKYTVHDIDMDSDEFFWEFEVTQATKPVEKQRTVTKYKQVEKERTVTKQRPETRYKKVTLLDYWLGR